MLKRIGCLLLAMLFVGCSGDASSTEAAADTGSGEGSAVGSGDGSGSGAPFEMPADVRPSSGCGKRSYGPGVNKLELTFGGLTRKYDLVLPDSYDDRLPLPMVMNLHPLVLGGPLHSIWTSQSALNAKGNAEGFIVVQPDGTGSPASWNAGEACCRPAFTNGIDDVGYIDALVKAIGELSCVDERRVYATGMSNGGYLSHRIACEHPERLAAIAPVVGSLSPELACVTGRGVPVLQISGSEDELASRQASVEAWVRINGCTEETAVTYEVGDVVCTTHTTCRDGAEVTHCVVNGGGHCPFTDVSPQATPGCDARPDIVAQEMIWAFLSRWKLP